MPRATSRLRALTILAGALLVAACSPAAAPSSAAPSSAAPSGSAASPSASAASPSASAASPSVSASPSAGGTTQTLALTGSEYKFDGPTSVPAGITTVTLQNAGQEEHQAQLAKLNDGKTFDDLVTALQAGDPSVALGLVSLAGGPTAVLPGATGDATTDLTPGNYAFLCFFSAPDGLPHIAKGMILPLQVTGTSAGGTLPAGDASVTGKDFSFEVTGPVAAGKHTFTFTNAGPQPHEAGVIKLADGVTAEQVVAAVAAPAPSGSASPSAPAAPPFTDVAGIAAIAPGTSGTFSVTLEAGASYAFICFVPDPATGAPHAALGMVTAIPTS